MLYHFQKSNESQIDNLLYQMFYIFLMTLILQMYLLIIFYIYKLIWSKIMPTADYVPQKDGDLVPWTENFIAVANANLPALGLIAGDITALTTKKSDYELSF